MANHVLKTDKAVFEYSWIGVKPYEIRFDDRDFKAGDEVVLAETEYSGEQMSSGAPLEYTGRAIYGTITHKLIGQYGLKDGWCILSIEDPGKTTTFSPGE